MTNVLHVGTYLVGSASLENALHEGHIAEFLYHLPVGYGWLAYA